MPMAGWIHQGIMAVHIASGMVAVASGTLAIAARKGGARHARAGTLFFATMLMLGITASILEPFRSPTPGSPLVGIFVCYFVLTSWVTARSRDGTTGKFEMVAGIMAIAVAAATAWGGINQSSTPVGRGPVFVMAGLSLLAGALDIKAFMLARLTAAQRISRHLWRMCFAFFIASGSFFIGQQDIMPAAVRGSPVLFAVGFAPLAVMIWWLARLRAAKPLGRVVETLRQRRTMVEMEG
jgi:hypothetical protein